MEHKTDKPEPATEYTSPPLKKTKMKTKKQETSDTIVIESLQKLTKQDDYDSFGCFVASEIRSMKSDRLKKNLN